MKYLTVTSPAYLDLTSQMIQSSGHDDWEIIDEDRQGDFGSADFNSLCNARMQIVLDWLKEGHNVFVCDGDVLWFRPIEEPPGDNWIIGQHDPDSGICCGVCYYRSCPQTIEIIDLCIREAEGKHQMFNDQVMLNAVLRQLGKRAQLKVSYFDNVLSWGLVREDDSLWTGQPINVPNDCHAWHANYTVGIDHKVRMLMDVGRTERTRNQ